MSRWFARLQSRLLFNAAAIGDVHFVNLALTGGGDPRRISSRMHRTPLIMNCGGPSPKVAIVRRLLAAGTDPGVIDVTGRTALDWARFRLKNLGPFSPDELPAPPIPAEEGELDILIECDGSTLDGLREAFPGKSLAFIKNHLDSARAAAFPPTTRRTELEAIIPILESPRPIPPD